MKKLLLFITVIAVVAVFTACAGSYAADDVTESTYAASVSETSGSSSRSSGTIVSKVLKNTGSEAAGSESTSSGTTSAVNETSSGIHTGSSVSSAASGIKNTSSGSSASVATSVSSFETEYVSSSSSENRPQQTDGNDASHSQPAETTSGKENISDFKRTTSSDHAAASVTEPTAPETEPETTSAPPEPETTAHTHCYVSSVSRCASCTTDGMITYSCICGASYTESIPATGHSWTEITESVKVYVCTCTHADANGNRDCWYQASSEISGPDALKAFRAHASAHPDGAGYTFQDSYTYEKSTGTYRCSICGATK